VLTGTNRSIKRLIVRAMAQAIVARTRSLAATSSTPREDTQETRNQKPESQKQTPSGFWPSDFRPLIPARPGGFSEGPTPDPIPNSAVKTLSANGTAP
jgi:hypothetical protein